MKKDKRYKRSDRSSRQKSKHTELTPDDGRILISGKSPDVYLLVLLLCFGIYHSVTYFGHQVVPNPDFTGFVNVGRQLLSFQLPSTYKRLPVMGMLQVCISSLVGGNHPDLTAGWLLNAILHPFNIVLIWLIGRRFIGRPAIWVAIVAAINPWTLRMVPDPIVETTLLFFTLLSFYFIVRRSKWAYLFASITSMVRYEGALLIFIAFLMDMIYAKDKRGRYWAFLWASIASIPLGLWIFGTILNWSGEGQTHYLKALGARSKGKIVFIEYIGLIWQVSFQPLFMLEPTASKDSFETLFSLSKVVTACSFAFGMIYGLIKRNWQILSFFVFLLLYLIIHAIQASLIPRHGVAVNWMVLIICVYGFQSLWQLINKNNRTPKTVIAALQIILLLLFTVWLIQMLPYLPKFAKKFSIRSIKLPYFSAAAVVLAFIIYTLFDRKKFLLRNLVISMLVLLIIASNQFFLVRIIGSGKGDIEFKMLADWYIKNAKEGEKLVTTMSNIVRIFAPQNKQCFLHTGGIKADSPSGFVRECREKNITYVAWDSRLGLTPNDWYYKKWRLENIAVLGQTRNVGPYEFVTQIQANKRRYINLFRLHFDNGQSGKTSN